MPGASSRGRRAPRIATCCLLADLERALGSGADFARKFDMTIDSAVVDALELGVVRPS